MGIDDDQLIVKGMKPLIPIPDTSMSRIIYDSLVKHCEKADALVDAVSGDAYTYRELFENSTALAQYLQNQNFGKDSFIGISSENSINFFIPVLATFFVGATIVPINPHYLQEELQHVLNICKPTLIFIGKHVSQKYLDVKQKMNFIQKLIVIDGRAEGCEALEDLYCQDGKFQLADIDPETQPLAVFCSSGTTGLPKGVMLSHKNFVMRYVHCLDPRIYLQTESILGYLPFIHLYGLSTSISAIIFGQKNVIIKRYQEDLFLETLQNYRIPILYAIPSLLVMLAKNPKVDNYNLSALEEIFFCSAPLGREIEIMVRARLPNLKHLRQGYGLTETSFTVITTPFGKEKVGSSGVVLPYVSVKVRDPDTGKSLGVNQVGEICFKSAFNMLGYWGNEKANREVFIDGGEWLQTGDLGYYDKENYFFIVDRLKELLKYNGFQVAPAELEAILLAHPKIRDAGVTGVPHETAGELPLAFVVKTPNAELEATEVIKFIEERVSSPKRLRGGVIFITEIPKNATGKILRRKLREIALKEMSYK